jgi:serine/threonine protein kinase/Tol biopolymer transport system component
MSLSPGTRVGPYEVVGLLGVGGMGEVLRAKDTKLNRDVALKVLPESVAGDPDRLARFQREAQVLAALNHPNIAHIHGFEDSGSVHAIVMELVEGPTLADRIALGPMPLDEALPIARQMAEAVEAAHEQGIIHRDLKPANVKVRDDGTVKVLDFGLAKVWMPESGSGTSDAMNSPTLTARATQVGMILGTAAYMAPEQAKGRPVDKRADIWAFGVVVHEMLTGERCFKGEDVSETLASVLKDRPAFDELPAGTPFRLKRLLERCLERDPKLRLRDMGEARVALSEVERGVPEPASTGASTSAASSPSPNASRLPWVVAGTFAAALIATLVMWSPWTPAPSAQVMRFGVLPQAPHHVALSTTDRTLALSPTGTHLAYEDIDGNLVIRAIDSLDSRPYPGVTLVRWPFFSPDGKWVGFFQDSALKKVAITGGPALMIAMAVGAPRGASWGPDDTIVFATAAPSTGLFTVSADGGDPKPLTTVEGPDADHLFPVLLPGGRAVLFTISATEVENYQIAVLNLDSGQQKVVIRGGSQAEYVQAPASRPSESGYLVYGAAGTLRAVRFDLEALDVLGAALPVVDQVHMTGRTGATQFGVSTSGTLVFMPGRFTADMGDERSMVWVDRRGQETPISNLPPRGYYTLRLSPDGARVAVEIRDQDNDVWVWDIRGERLTRLTLDKASDSMPIWTPDSRRIIFRSTTAGSPGNLFWQAADGTGVAERLTTVPDRQQTPTSVTPDGRILTTESGRSPLVSFIGGLTLDKREFAPVLTAPYALRNAQVSPDGRFLVYESDEMNAPEVFVRPFPDVNAGRWQVSTTGGIRPAWGPDGRELFYVQVSAAGTADLMSAPISTTPTFQAGKPVKLFAVSRFAGQGNGRPYDVANDGKRFIVIKDEPVPTDPIAAAARQAIVFVVNWTEELKAKLPVR